MTKTTQGITHVKPKKKEKILNFDPSKEGQGAKTLHNLNSTNFVNSYKYGYLEKKSENWFRAWHEKFCVMTNVGLLYYNRPDERPRNLFPTIDAKIVPVSAKKYKKKWVFLIKSFKWEIIFAAQGEQDYNEWMEAFALV